MATVNLLAALEAHSIPTEPYATLPGLAVSPSGQPYIPLPPPLADYCLTNHLPPSSVSPPPATPSDGGPPPAAPSTSTEGSEQDAQDLHRLLNADYFRGVLAMFLAGKKDALTLEKARENVRAALDQADATRGWCMPIIRRTADVLSSPLPHLLGSVAVTRFHYLSFGPDEAARRKAAQALRGPRECYWSFSCWLDPSVGSRGVVTAAMNYIIAHWYLPHVHAFRGQLVSGFLASNAASRRLHDKLGFKTVGKSYWLVDARRRNGLDELGLAEQRARAALVGAEGGDGGGGEDERAVKEEVRAERERWRSAVSVWQGVGMQEPVSKAESVFAELEDWD